MSARDRVDPAKTRQVVLALADWLQSDETLPPPDTDVLAAAARTLRRAGPWRQRRSPDPTVCCGAVSFLGPGTLRHTPNVRRADRPTDLAPGAGLVGGGAGPGSGAAARPAGR